MYKKLLIAFSLLTLIFAALAFKWGADYRHSAEERNPVMAECIKEARSAKLAEQAIVPTCTCIADHSGKEFHWTSDLWAPVYQSDSLAVRSLFVLIIGSCQVYGTKRK